MGTVSRIKKGGPKGACNTATALIATQTSGKEVQAVTDGNSTPAHPPQQEPAERSGSDAYREFIRRKSQVGTAAGFAPVWIPDWLFDFQKHLVEWAIRRGRSAILADCGLGKGPMQLVWAENVVRKTGGRVLIVAPLAVSAQTVREGEKFGIESRVSRDGKAFPGITVTNYERLHHFNANDFKGVVCDESSILKNFDGRRRRIVTEFLRTLPYRLLCSATAAPNDHAELGTSAEALGELGHQDMLARFFKHDDNSLFLHGTKYGDFTANRWRFKAHAERPFWRWVCSWARACRRPSDLGCDDAGFVLPELVTHEHEVKASRPASGFLFDLPASSLAEQREEQRRTLRERCEKVAELASHAEPVVCWCHLNGEGDLLESLVPGAVQVAGSDPDGKKEETLLAFAAGQIRALVSKPSIAGFGLNWQHCAHQTYFPSHSFEQWYQGVRRCWRFGQTRPVVVDVVTTDGAAGVLANMRRKAEQADRMFSELVANMNDALRLEAGAFGDSNTEVPGWLR
jgi:hypothetical protein